MLHDLRIPIPGFKTNIDHAVISGRSVLLINRQRTLRAFRSIHPAKASEGANRKQFRVT